jgi:hypothetical protein
MLVGLCTRDRLIREAEPARLASWITMARQTEFFAVATEARRFTDVLSTGPCWFRLISSCYAGHAYAA